MSVITEILDRLSSLASLKECVAETNRHVDKSLAWLLDHEKRLIHLETGVAQRSPVVAAARHRRLPGTT